MGFGVQGSGFGVGETGGRHCPAFPLLARGREPGTPGCADGASKGMDCHRLTPIDVAAMSNPNDLDDQDGFHDGVDDSVVADSDPSLIVWALEHAQFRCSVLSGAKQAWRGGRSRRIADTSMQPDKATRRCSPLRTLQMG